MLITITRDVEVNGRKYLAGETREFQDGTAQVLIDAAQAVLFVEPQEKPAPVEMPEPVELPEPVKKVSKKK